MKKEQIEGRRARRFTLNMRLALLLFVTAIPLTAMMLGILNMIREYSESYNDIIDNLKVANEFNIKFKEDMEYSMYRVMIGLIDASKFEDGDILEGSTKYATVVKNPIHMIESARYSFGTAIDRVPGSDSDIKIKGILSCLDALETTVDRMIDNSSVPGTYTESETIWENDIKGLCSMIQDYITQYTYYELINMEKLQKQLEEQMQQSVRIFIVLLVAVLAAGFGLSTMITKTVTTPINSLRQTAELRLLQEQINPHFLYNTLDTIVWLIEGHASDKAVNMVVSLSEFFRLVLSKGKEYITIQEEEMHIRSYLEIQQVRYRDILEYRIDIAPELYRYKILKLTLQPLVENSLYHGIKYKRAKGVIVVTGKLLGDTVLFQVQDNGVGMEKEELDNLRSEIMKPCQDTGKGFGLANVNERIRMNFGVEYGMEIDSAPGQGTCVEVVIPAIPYEG